MKEIFQRIIFFSKIPYFYLLILLSLFLNFLLWLTLIWRLPPSIQWIPLHYNIYFGIDWIGPWWQIFFYPLICLLIIILNFFLCLFIIIKDKLFALIITYAALLTQFFVLFALIILLMKYFS